MEDVKQILVVDDYFQMLEFLRSVLEFSHHEYQVLAVPSAEEGILELRRTRFDLVITDVRLPGMSGFDMVRKMKTFNANIPVIMITGYSSEQGKKEADELGVKRYFKKPLDPDELLATVHSVLYGAEEVEVVQAPETTEAVDISADVRRRLESLRSDTGARHVVLSTDKGDILHDGGVGQELDLPDLVSSITESMQASFHLAQKLESSEPFTIQYQAGERHDLYLANIGRDYFLTLFFDAQARRGRLGTIWVFAQRAINDLQGLLNKQGTVRTQKPAAAKSAPAARSAPKRRQPTADPPRPVRKVEAKAEPVPVEETPKREIAEVPELEPAKELDPQTLAEIQKMLGIQVGGDSEAVDLDSFWDIDFEDPDAKSQAGMSLEEARKQGLIPTDFDDTGTSKDSD